MTSLDRKIERQFHEWKLDTDEPSWSSHWIESFVASVSADEGDLSDIYRALFRFLGTLPWSESLEFFVEQMTVLANYDEYHNRFMTSDLQWLRDGMHRRCTTLQGYMAYRLLPFEMYTPECLVSTLRPLAGTAKWPAAIALYEDLAEHGIDVRMALREWLEEGVPPPHEADVVRLAYGSPR